MIGEIVYTNDFPIFDQSDDDDELQAETNHAGQPEVDWCHEFHYHQLERNNKLIQSIRNSFHIIGSQQSISCDDEVEKKEEFLEQNEDKDPSPERVEVIKDTPTQKHDDLFTEYNPLNQSIPGLKEDNTTIYDESSSSDNNEDEEEVISKKILKLDPVEKKVILVEKYLSRSLCSFLEDI